MRELEKAALLERKQKEWGAERDYITQRLTDLTERLGYLMYEAPNSGEIEKLWGERASVLRHEARLKIRIADYLASNRPSYDSRSPVGRRRRRASYDRELDGLEALHCLTEEQRVRRNQLRTRLGRQTRKYKKRNADAQAIGEDRV